MVGVDSRRGRWQQVLGLRAADDVGEGGVLDGLVLGGESPLVLAPVLLPARHFELFDVQVWVLTDPVEVPACRT